MRVLYVNQISQISGAERSLLALLGGLPEEVLPSLARPPGDLRSAAASTGAATHACPAPAGGPRQPPLRPPAGAAWLMRAAVRRRALARREDAALVHANSTRAALAAGLAARIGGAPVVAHVRDWVPPGRRGR